MLIQPDGSPDGFKVVPRWGEGRGVVEVEVQLDTQIERQIETSRGAEKAAGEATRQTISACK